jgi:hypothetical protein
MEGYAQAAVELERKEFSRDLDFSPILSIPWTTSS